MNQMNSKSTGSRLNLLRLKVGWSAAECAYRFTIQANQNITTEDWIEWERSSDEEPRGRDLNAALDDISAIFGIERSYFDESAIPVPENVHPFQKKTRSKEIDT